MATILIDNSILRDGVIGQWTTRKHAVQWGPTAVSIDVATFARRPMPSPDQVARIANIEALPTIRRLARDGRLGLLTSTELKYEDWVGKNPAVGTVGDLFSDITLGIAESPVERSFFHQTADMKAYLSRDLLRKFCKMLLNLRDDQIRYASENMRDLPDCSKRGLADIHRFRKLCASAPEKHYPDLFHWWTAEHAGCKFFLTMDQKFINFVRRQCVGVIGAQVVDPVRLLEALGVTERDSMPLAPNEEMNYFGAVRFADEEG